MPRARLLLALLLILPAFLHAAERPNIIVILSDDMGFSDIGCYGGEIETPNLDSLAAGGLRFTQFYNTGRCCPTRASLLTGLYPHQAGIGHMMNDRGYDGYRGELNRRCVTIAESLGSQGYRCYISGKWHVASKVNPQAESDKDNWPLQRGFHRFYGTIHGAGSFFDPNTLTRDNDYISPFADPEYHPRGGVFYYTDAISDHAVRFITEHQKENGAEPFFLYVAYTAAHWPMHALPEDIEKYEGNYDDGFVPTHEARYKRMLEMGLIEEKWGRNPLVWDWETKVKDKEWESANMEVYAAMVDSMDRGIGRVCGALKAHGQFENTLILYMQDNGGCAEGYGRRDHGGKPPQRPDKPTLKPLADDYLQPDMNPKQTRDGYPVRQGVGVMPGPADTLIGYGEGWANVSNTPFRLYKHYVHEGGIATPLVAHWPNGIERPGGELEHQPGHLVDIMATALDVAGAEHPTEFGGEVIKPLEGTSLRPAFAAREIDRRSPLFWEHEGNRAIRDGKWKLVARGANGPWELYDMEADRTEMHDLAKKNPEKAEALAAAWQAYAERANVLPLNPGSKKRNSAPKKKGKK